MAGRGTDIPLSDRARAKGGLHVIAAELHESARIDRQLAGRSARQGDPGSYQPFASLEDKLFRENQQEANTILRRCRAAQVTEANEFTIAVSREIAAMQARIQNYRIQERSRMNQQDKWIESVQSALARRA